MRFMLEEGKLNLCVRLMHEYRKALAALAPPSERYSAWLQSTAAATELHDVSLLTSRMLTFEQSLGVLLRCALEHVESVQTADLPELMCHIGEILAAAASKPSSSINFERTQVRRVAILPHPPPATPNPQLAPSHASTNAPPRTRVSPPCPTGADGAAVPPFDHVARRGH